MLFSASHILYSIIVAYLAVGGVEAAVQRLLVLRVVLTPDGLVPHLVAVDVLHLGVLDEVILPPAGSHQTR